MTNGQPRRTKFPANHIGPQIKRLRRARGWSQAKLAERLQLNGLDVGRDVVAQMESQFHCIRDKDILYLARVFKVGMADFFISLDQ
jgi:transcriptional regulator with XRE-family HTH domain